MRIPDSDLAASVDLKLNDWDKRDICRRIWGKDHTVWSSDPTELSDRLGWLVLPETSESLVAPIEQFAEGIRAEGMRHVVLLGMGGSSLAPEVFGRVFGSAAGYPTLLVLDSTHPSAVAAVESLIDPANTLFLVSSKSGTTLETLSLYQFFWNRVGLVSDKPGEHFVAITDPDSKLEQIAKERSFRRIFSAPPTVGGRYSALCAFGLVPAGLVGADTSGILASAREMARASAADVAASENPSVTLGVTLATLADAGIDKLTFVCSPALSSFPAWIEQLVAESVGKDSKGIVPIDSESFLKLESLGADRVFFGITLEGENNGEVGHHLSSLVHAGHPVISCVLSQKTDIGAEMFRWELATAAAGAAMGIHPFNQPDVQLAKSLAKEAMASKDGYRGGTSASIVDVFDEPTLSKSLGDWSQIKPGDYIGIQAYLEPSDVNTEILKGVRKILGNRLGVATTLGYGPRFLHSTGQLHKGGDNNGLFLQLVDEPQSDIPVPESDFTFGELIAAQAEGDFNALVQRGRRVLRVGLGRDPGSGLERLRGALAAF